jgi:hypothetical protein
MTREAIGTPVAAKKAKTKKLLGLSAEAALAAVGPTGHVTATDVSPAMAEKARERLGKAPNASVFVEDGQALLPNIFFTLLVTQLGRSCF